MARDVERRGNNCAFVRSVPENKFQCCADSMGSVPRPAYAERTARLSKLRANPPCSLVTLQEAGKFASLSLGSGAGSAKKGFDWDGVRRQGSWVMQISKVRVNCSYCR